MVTANGKVSSKTNTQSTKTGSKTSTQSAKTSSRAGTLSAKVISALGAKVSSTVNKSSNTSSVKTSNTISQGSGQILKKTTTYVTDAAAIYTSSGSVSTYACGTTKQARKDPSESCMSCNRPSASYLEQFNQSKSVKADKSQKVTDSKVSKPVSPAVPKKKSDTKKESTKNKKSAPIKEYMPSDSRNGAGEAFYREKTTPSGAKEGASFLISCVPVVGDVKDIQESVTGKDQITGKKLSKTDRIMTAALACLPVISGSSARAVKNGIKYGNKATKKTVKKAVRKGSSKSEKSTKTVKKAIGKVTKKSDDVREKAVSKLKKGTKEIGKTDTGKKTVKKSEEHVKIKESGVKKKEEAAGKVHRDGVVSKSGSKTYKEVNIHGKINTEIDEVDLVNQIIYEDKSAGKLYMKNADFPQTEQQWAFKQIYKKGSNRIDAINQSEYTLSIVGSENVPNINLLKSIRNYVFRIDADTPELRQAVGQCLDKLRAKYPEYNFSATYGGK